MKILVLGGDGFCGWPTSLRLAKNHDVFILDNLSRRQIDDDLGTNSLTSIRDYSHRINVARELGFNLDADIADVTDYEQLKFWIKKVKPNAIIQFAEQRAAPYSMLGSKESTYTVNNNITGTHNVLAAIVEVDPTIHLVHLGTMGVYGYSKEFGSIPEGYLDITINETNEEASVLYPTNPGSVYHMTKSLDQIMFQFYKKNWNLNITDLHQGIV